jgi:hypothetical protein
VTLWRTGEYKPPTVCQHVTEHIALDAETEIAPYEIAGVEGVACTAQLEESRQFRGAVPLLFGALAFDATAADDEQLALAKQILKTVRTETS